MKLVTREEYLMGRDKEYPLNPEQEKNLENLMKCLELFQCFYGHELKVRSGYRPAAINARIAGAAPKSKHIECLAIDFADPDGTLAYWCLCNIPVLEKCGLYMEHPDFTEKADGMGWVHLQCVKPRSGKRIFKP